MTKYIAIAILLSLSACAALPQGDRQALADFTVSDLKAAHASAVQTNDAVAARCWEVLAKHVNERAAAPTTEAVGAATAWQMARNLRRRLEQGVPEEVNAACAPLVTSAAGTVLKLRKLIGL